MSQLELNLPPDKLYLKLTPGQIVRIRILHEIMGSKWSSGLTDTIKNFAIDLCSERELQISERSVATYLVVTGASRFDIMHKDECWSLILDLFIGREKINREKLHHLTEADAQRIEAIYDSNFNE